MSKKLVVYYSMGGNTRFIAQAVANAVGADLMELKPVKPLDPNSSARYFIGGMQSLFKLKPALQPLDKNPQDYDLLFVGAPVWASTYAAPLNTFLARLTAQGKKVALFVCCGDPQGKAFPGMKKALGGNEVIGQIEFQEPLARDKDASQARAAAWAQEMAGHQGDDQEA